MCVGVADSLIRVKLIDAQLWANYKEMKMTKNTYNQQQHPRCKSIKNTNK